MLHLHLWQGLSGSLATHHVHHGGWIHRLGTEERCATTLRRCVEMITTHEIFKLTYLTGGPTITRQLSVFFLRK